MKLIVVNLVLIFSLGASAGSNVPIGPDEVFRQGTAANEIKLMSYNVLNLFDAEKDGNHDDWAFLPLSFPNKQEHCKTMSPGSDKEMCMELDWTDYKVDLKVNQIAEVIKFQGSLPDILVLEEIENEKVIEKIARKLGYDDYSVTDSGTVRGTDVAILFTTKNLTRIGDESIDVSIPNKSRTRDILRVDFRVKTTNEVLSVYANHWPAQSHSNEFRLFVANKLKLDVDKQTQKYGKGGYYSIALGDFNVVEKDSPNPVGDLLLSSNWQNQMIDGHYLALATKGNPALKYMPSGTYYYAKDRRWNLLDQVILSKNLKDRRGIEYVPESYRIVFPKFMSKDLKLKSFNIKEIDTEGVVRVPLKYNFFSTDPNTLGYSDHLPIVFKLRY